MVTLAILWLMTGSVVLPVKALLMNALTTATATGVLVFVFQDGRLTGVLDYVSQGGIEQTDFLVLAAIAFALSTDYGVLLMTRIKEARDGGRDNRAAIAVGLEHTGRVVSASAVLLAVAIGAFATSKIIFLKEIGLGAVVAVLVDAFVVRSTLVPSLMALLGEWNWWSPPALRRFHDWIGLDEDPDGDLPASCGGGRRDRPARAADGIVTEDRPLAREIRWPAVGLLAAFLVAGAFTREPQDLGLSAACCVMAIAAASMLCAYGARMAVALAALAGAGVALDAGGHGQCLAWFGLCVLAFWAMIVAGPKLGVLFLLAAEALLIGHLLTPHVDLGWTPWVAGVAVSAGGAALIARQQQLVTELRAAQAGLAERSRADERNRIARDLHDVIAHSLTVSLLHIASARLALSEDPVDAARALVQAERLGRQSLEEVRSIVGLMRSGDDDDGSRLAPVQGLEALDELVERFRSAGAEVELHRSGNVASLPATASTTLYRIAQEAFTNAAKHAPGRAVSVRLAAAGGRVELTVESSGVPGSGRGMGLETMRERAEAIGGTCEAGPGGSGWRVRASVPVKGAP